MKEDKFGVRTAVLLGAFFILVILLGSFVGRKLVNVVRASIDPMEKSTSVLTEEKGVSLPIETESSEQEIVERVYLEEIPLEGEGDAVTSTDPAQDLPEEHLGISDESNQTLSEEDLSMPGESDHVLSEEDATSPDDPEQGVGSSEVKGGVVPTFTPTPPPTKTPPPPTATPTESPTPTATMTATYTVTPTETAPPTKLPTVGPGGSPERAKGVGLIFALLGSVALCAFFAGLASSKLKP
ncbi:MAG: hypothetical protein ACOYKC_05160 [Anaerolineaceae bacterium]|jgi:hypothetical protein